MRLVVRDVEVVELRAVVVADEPGRLLEVLGLELHDGRRAEAVRLLAPRDQRLAEQAADRLAAVQPQVPGPRGQAEELLGLRRAQPLEVDRAAARASKSSRTRRRSETGAAGRSGAGDLERAAVPARPAVRSQPSSPQTIVLDRGLAAERAAAAVAQRPAAQIDHVGLAVLASRRGRRGRRAAARRRADGARSGCRCPDGARRARSASRERAMVTAWPQPVPPSAVSR